MNKYETGILAWKPAKEHFGMIVKGLWKIDGFHCGDCLDIWDYETKKWIPTRIKYVGLYPAALNNYYLENTGLHGSDLDGLRIRIEEY